MDGPRCTPSGREISTTGHANEMSAPWHWGLPELGTARMCDRPEGFRFVVRDEIKRGADPSEDITYLANRQPVAVLQGGEVLRGALPVRQPALSAAGSSR